MDENKTQEQVKEFEPVTINSQEELDKIIKDRLNRINKQHSEATAELQRELDDVKAQFETYKTKESENNSKASAEVESMKKQIAKYESDSVKTNVAIELGLPLEMRDRLKGETEDDIRADAQALLSILPKTSMPQKTSEPVLTPEESNKQAFKEMLSNL